MAQKRKDENGVTGRAALVQRLEEIKPLMADPNYWPAAASAEEELSFAMAVRSGGYSITGRSPGQIRNDLIREEKSRRLLWPMHPSSLNQIRSTWDRCAENRSTFDTVLQGLLLALDSSVSPAQASPEIHDVQSPVCTSDPLNTGIGFDQSQSAA